VKLRRSILSGAALIIVLLFIVLLAGVLVPVVWRSGSLRRNMGLLNAQIAADELSRSALALVVGELRRNIMDGLAFERDEAWEGLPSLLCISEGPVSSAKPSLNGADDRNVSPERWNSHYLNPRKNPSSTAIDSTPDDVFPVPGWIYMTASGTQSAVKPTDAVIGRIAWAVYDTSGLLDVNVAGFPSNADPDADGLERTVASLGFFDLRAVHLDKYELPAEQADNLVGWRHYSFANGTFSYNTKLFFSDDDAAGYFDLMLSRIDGFLRAAEGGQMFLTRETLLEFRRAAGFTQNILPYLTAFSRYATAPVLPGDLRCANAGVLHHWHDDGRSEERRSIKAGAPFPQTRFSLGKLAWFSGTVSATPEAMLACFGLVWDEDNGRWEYTANKTWDEDSQGWMYEEIEELASIARKPALREPDFFEMIKAGMDQPPGDEKIIETGIRLIALTGTNLTIHFNGQDIGIDVDDPDDLIVLLSERRFRSAGEMRRVRTDAKGWLELFSVGDEPPVVAGKINPASAPLAVLKSAIVGPNIKTQFEAQKNAERMIQHFREHPSAAGFASLANEEEGLCALAPVVNLRTQNFFIDVVAQTGKFPPDAGAMDDFVVQAERRYWLHIAIDRFTGEIVGQMLEPVEE